MSFHIGIVDQRYDYGEEDDNPHQDGRQWLRREDGLLQAFTRQQEESLWLTDEIAKNEDSPMLEIHAGRERGATNAWPPYCRLDLIVILALSTLSVLLTIGIGDKSYDDAYITYRYARNLALGHGFVYNPGESLLGTTTPLFTLLLASVASLFSLDVIPKLGQWLAGLSILCCAVFTYLLARDDGKRFGGSIAALFVLINPVFIFFWGGETPLLIALILIAFFLYFR